MRQPTTTYHTIPWRGGDEGDLLKQTLLLELCEMLTLQRGEFWCMFAGLEGEEGLRMADMPALDWFAVAEGSGPRSAWQNTALWKAQRPSLLRGEFLSLVAVVLRQLQPWHQRGVFGRVVVTDRDPARFKSLEPFLAAAHPGQGDWDHDQWPFRLYQMLGEPAQILKDMAYGGVVRGPGIACLLIPESLSYPGSWAALIETLLLRQVWVMIVIPPDWLTGRGFLQKSAYRRLRDAVQYLHYPGILFQLKERSLSAKPNQISEFWLLSPESNLSLVGKKLEQAVTQLLVDGLGRDVKRGTVTGLRVENMFDNHSRLTTFRANFPVALTPSLHIVWPQEHDIPDVVHLWEQLMDEHAVLDNHFQRRSLAGVHLRQSLLVQLTQPEHLMLLAKQGSSVVGFLTAQVLRAPLFQSSRIGQIVDIFVLPAWRNQHIGQSLVSWALQWFEALELEQIDLNVALGNEKGRTFWTRLGFRPYLQVVSRHKGVLE